MVSVKRPRILIYLLATPSCKVFTGKGEFFAGIEPVSARSTGLNLVGLLLLEHVLPAVDARVGVGPPHTGCTTGRHRGLLPTVRLNRTQMLTGVLNLKYILHLVRTRFK